MIALTLILGMTMFQLLITVEWLRREWRSCKASFQRPLATYQREPRTYMLTASELARAKVSGSADRR